MPFKKTNMITVQRYHDISCGHRVVGHEGKCKYLHGHNYRIHFTIGADKMDNLGRVLDFSVIKSRLSMWLETNYDHKFLIWEEDEILPQLQKIVEDSLVIVPFNPTAENIAKHLVQTIGPIQLEGTGTTLISCRVEETRKCSATYSIPFP